ncbi:hypothetical protein P7K49_007912 [Saguinus oedipus]|uniref:Uncharacterized protein n=1 Tax=Saguinus oedipus TaxID=9490 RepID=A0ABQ9VWZ9_SAGOE|nr:hypothetical protein P7K49_007912 [Saguinus oedipus]
MWAGSKPGNLELAALRGCGAGAATRAAPGGEGPKGDELVQSPPNSTQMGTLTFLGHKPLGLTVPGEQTSWQQTDGLISTSPETQGPVPALKAAQSLQPMSSLTTPPLCQGLGLCFGTFSLAE